MIYTRYETQSDSTQIPLNSVYYLLENVLFKIFALLIFPAIFTFLVISLNAFNWATVSPNQKLFHWNEKYKNSTLSFYSW